MSGTKSDRCPNIFDLYLNHNIRAAKEGRVSDIVGDLAIIGVLIGTQFAGSDTSQAGSTSGLTFIAEDENLQQKVLEACKDGNSDQIIENQTMHKFTLEILRFCNPVPGLIPRVVSAILRLMALKSRKVIGYVGQLVLAGPSQMSLAKTMLISILKDTRRNLGNLEWTLSHSVMAKGIVLVGIWGRSW